MKIVIGNDHAAVELKNEIMAYVQGLGHEVVNFGVDTNASCNYPEIGAAVGRAVVEEDYDCGILICGTGIGMSIAVNRFPYVRGALVFTPEMATLSRQHNDSNVLILGARTTTTETAVACMQAFLKANFEGGRHEKRVAKLGGLSC